MICPHACSFAFSFQCYTSASLVQFRLSVLLSVPAEQFDMIATYVLWPLQELLHTMQLCRQHSLELLVLIFSANVLSAPTISNLY